MNASLAKRMRGPALVAALAAAATATATAAASSSASLPSDPPGRSTSPRTTTTSAADGSSSSSVFSPFRDGRGTGSSELPSRRNSPSSAPERRLPPRRVRPDDGDDELGRPKIVFLGSGSSTGCPRPLCSLLFPPPLDLSRYDDRGAAAGGKENEESLESLRRRMKKACRTSALASRGDPRTNRDYRGNPSLLVSHRNSDDVEDETDDGRRPPPPPMRNVVIDVGKTFRENSLRFLPGLGVHSLDAVILTHEHMDAVGGLDDVRGFQKSIPGWTGKGFPPRVPVPVYSSRRCIDAVARQFPYLVPRAVREQKVKRAVAALDFRVVEEFEPFVAAGLRVVPLPVMHGEDLVCLGYAFTLRDDCDDSSDDDDDDDDGSSSDAPESRRREMNVVYLSDISRMLPETLSYIRNSLPAPIDVLVVDSLNVNRPVPVHYSLDQALELVDQLNPLQTYVVGVNCDDFWPHDETNRRLKEEMGRKNVELAYDGLALTVGGGGKKGK